MSVVFEPGGTETERDTLASDYVNLFGGNITVTKAQKLHKAASKLNDLNVCFINRKHDKVKT